MPYPITESLPTIQTPAPILPKYIHTTEYSGSTKEFATLVPSDGDQFPRVRVTLTIIKQSDGIISLFWEMAILEQNQMKKQIWGDNSHLYPCVQSISPIHNAEA